MVNIKNGGPVLFEKSYISEGLNGVNRQPSNGLKINRQPSKTEYFYRQPSNERAKISRQFLSFLFFFNNCFIFFNLFKFFLYFLNNLLNNFFNFFKFFFKIFQTIFQIFLNNSFFQI